MCGENTSNFGRGNLAVTALHVLLTLAKPRLGFAVMQFLEQKNGETFAKAQRVAIHCTTDDEVSSTIILIRENARRGLR